jgi:hypothetical protein
MVWLCMVMHLLAHRGLLWGQWLAMMPTSKQHAGVLQVQVHGNACDYAAGRTGTGFAHLPRVCTVKLTHFSASYCSSATVCSEYQGEAGRGWVQWWHRLEQAAPPTRASGGTMQSPRAACVLKEARKKEEPHVWFPIRATETGLSPLGRCTTVS